MKKIFLLVFFICFPLLVRAGKTGDILCITGSVSDGRCLPAEENQSQPASAFDPINNRYLVVWTDYREKNTKGADIYGHIFKADETGISLLGEDILISNSEGDQTEPKVAFDPQNQRYLVVWTDTRSNNARIYGQFLDKDGNLLGGNFQISRSNGDGLVQFYAQMAPDVVYNKVLNTFQVVWLDVTDLEHYYDLSDTLCGDQVSYVLIKSPYADDYLIRWRNVDFNDSQDSDADGDGSPLDSTIKNHTAYVISDYKRNMTCESISQKLELMYNLTVMNDEANPRISYNPQTGEPFVVWAGKVSRLTYTVTFERKRNSESDPWGLPQKNEEYKAEPSANLSIFGRIYLPTIVKDLTLSDTSKDAFRPAITLNPETKMWFVVFESEKRIYGQLIMIENNMPYGSRIQISASDVTGPASSPYTALDPVNQRYVVVWEDARNQSTNISNIDLYGQFVDPQGNLSGGNFPVTVLSGNQLEPVSVFGDSDFPKFLILWKDGTDPGNAEIRGQIWEYSVAPQILIADENGNPNYASLIDFGTVGVGSSLTKSFSIWNFGNAPLTIEQISSPSAPFSVTTTPPRTIAPGSSYPMDVKFEPHELGSYAYAEGSGFKIDIKSDGGDVSVYLAGTATTGTTGGTGTQPGGTGGSGAQPAPTSEGGGGAKGCFIAEAAFGSYLHPHVQVLRKFRDKHLSTNRIGKAFVELYYRHSPPLAKVIKEYAGLRIVVRMMLTPVVYLVEYPAISFLLFASVFLFALRAIFKRRGLLGQKGGNRVKKL